MKNTRYRLVLLLLGAMLASPTFAADLGGDCCTDLEERVAELEATAVQKGNRKVSVKLSGQVNLLLLVWDDGEDTDAYIVDNTESSTRFRFTGAAKFKPGWSAGFVIEVEVETARSLSADQKSDGDPTENADSRLEGRALATWLKHDRLGQLHIGRWSPATDNIKLLNVANTPDVDATLETGGGFFLRAKSGAGGCQGAACLINQTLASLAPGGDTRRANVLRYDTPSLAGFIFSTAWGEDDLFDIAVRYDKTWNSIHVKGGIGYLWDTDEDEDNDMLGCGPSGTALNGFGATAGPCRGARVDFERLTGSLSLIHMPTGLYAYLGGHRDEFNKPSGTPGVVTGRLADETGTNWYIQGGIKRRLLAPSLGKTILYGQYREWNDFQVGNNGSAFTTVTGLPAIATEISDTDVQSWGIGLVQEIDAAAMQLWVNFQQFDADLTVIQTTGASAAVPLEQFRFFQVGGKILF